MTAKQNSPLGWRADIMQKVDQLTAPRDQLPDSIPAARRLRKVSGHHKPVADPGLSRALDRQSRR